MMREETSEIVVELHNIARKLEQGKYWVFGKDLRDLADRLARVSKRYDLTTEEFLALSEENQVAYNYTRAINGMEIIDV